MDHDEREVTKMSFPITFSVLPAASHADFSLPASYLVSRPFRLTDILIILGRNQASMKIDRNLTLERKAQRREKALKVCKHQPAWLEASRTRLNAGLGCAVNARAP